MDATAYDGWGGIVGKYYGVLCQLYAAVRSRDLLGSSVADRHAGHVFFCRMGKSTGKVVELSTLIITITSLSLTALGALFVYRQTSLTFVKDERDEYRRKCSECEQAMTGLMRENRWLLNRLSQYEDPSQLRRSRWPGSQDPEKSD
jgi:hypothetical protein